MKTQVIMYCCQKLFNLSLILLRHLVLLLKFQYPDSLPILYILTQPFFHFQWNKWYFLPK
uniref:Uncharacterized protein n=1 Tax=Anguilla anguilla TaxID=7936 RepID=A0A0E9RDX4_ANGAN